MNASDILHTLNRLRECKTAPRQIEVLMHVASCSCNEIQPDHLAKDMRISVQTVANYIGELILKGYIELSAKTYKDSCSRSYHKIKLTRDGKKFVRSFL